MTSTTETMGSLYEDDYLRSSYSLDISVIMTPISKLKIYKPGSVSSACDLEVKQWDQDFKTGPYALIGESTHHITGWASWGLYYEAYREYKFDSRMALPIKAHMNDVIRCLRDHKGMLIKDADGPNPEETVGAIFPLYLNRYQVRSFFYYWILGLEIRSLQYVGKLYPNDKVMRDKINQLFPISQFPKTLKELENILRDRKDAGQKDAHLSECLYLWQVLSVLNNDRRMQTIKWLLEESFEVDSDDARSFRAEDLKKVTVNELVDFRNSIMHPMSLLVTSDESVKYLVMMYVLVKKMAQILDRKINVMR